jgi:hypothetical protein
LFFGELRGVGFADEVTERYREPFGDAGTEQKRALSAGAAPQGDCMAAAMVVQVKEITKLAIGHPLFAGILAA